MSRLLGGSLILMGLLTSGLASQSGGPAPVPYPDGFRSWAHVKSALVSERHPDFARSGGFRHIYANPAALTGYRTGTFPEGSTIVVDWVEAQDANGSFAEGARLRIDVMVKDKTRYARPRAGDSNDSAATVRPNGW